MTSLRLSHRAVAASAAFLLGGAGLAGPAFAGEGNGHGHGKPAKSEAKGGKSGAKGSSGAQGGRDAKGGDKGDPAGNNGTFKVDGLPFNDGMANEPHVTCGFRLKFFGFDEGQTGDITIAGHAPSGSGVVSKRTDVLISDDAAGGGPNDPDAVVTYTAADLNLAGLTAHPKQGYHLKVTLNTDTPGGKKHKVFWFEPCASETTPEVGGTDETVTPPTTPTVPTTVEGTVQERTDVGGTTTATTGTSPTDTAVLGTRFTRTPSSGATLPFTGAPVGLLLLAGAGLVVTGAGAVAVARTRS